MMNPMILPDRTKAPFMAGFDVLGWLGVDAFAAGV